MPDPPTGSRLGHPAADPVQRLGGPRDGVEGAQAQCRFGCAWRPHRGSSLGPIHCSHDRDFGWTPCRNTAFAYACRSIVQ